MANTRGSQYYVSVEEFIPRADADHMLQLVDNLERLEPVETKLAFSDLKRAMAWMRRYISPTSEFWEWTNDRFEIDGKTALTVQLIGFGWAVAVTSKTPVTETEVSAEEKRLLQVIEKLTGYIPVKAVIRMKSSPWTRHELGEVSKILELHGVACVVRGMSLIIPALGVKIHAEPEQRLECPGISRDTAKRVESVLRLIKEYANRKNEGASWCAYQRRRLTLVHKIGCEQVSPVDLRFLKHPEYGMGGEVLASRVTFSGNRVGTLCLVRAKYHLGNIHPRALVAVNDHTAALWDLSTYVYYAWNSHFTRIWLYLLFEDAYAYANELETSKRYVDPMILDYWHNLLRTDEIITEMRAHERVDSGQFQSYNPPHDKFLEECAPVDGASTSITPLRWLREFLIEATTTQLYEDPLKRAVVLLEEMDRHMKSDLTLFVQTADIRIQKTLQLLQLLFVVAAVSQVVQLVAEAMLPLENLALVFAFTLVTLLLLRMPAVRRLIDWIMG